MATLELGNEVAMFKHLFVTIFVVVTLVGFAPPARTGMDRPVLAAGQPQHQEHSAPADAQARNEIMMCHNMMAEMKAADAGLEQLVKAMNAATGEAKVAALAQIVTELVRQRTAMHDHMMAPGAMMNGRSGMMKK
jgi:hypothetical protein